MVTSVAGNPLQAHIDLLEKTSGADAFNSERDLISVVIEQINHFMEGTNVFASTELPIGAGTVDIVAGKITRAHRARNHVSLASFEAYILAHLYFKQRLKASTVARKVDLPLQDVENTLIRLCDKGYCVTSNQCYLRSKTFVDGLIAIEGKIKNWRRALQQASRNRLFSSQSFVALDAKYSKPALKQIDLFREARVGLAIVFREGQVSVLYKPPKSRPLAPVLPIIAESALLGRVT